MKQVQQIGQGLQFVLLLIMVFRSLIHGLLDSVFFLLLGLYFLLVALDNVFIFIKDKDQMALFLAIAQALAGILFFFIK